jgi:hypothetical protein
MGLPPKKAHGLGPNLEKKTVVCHRCGRKKIVVQVWPEDPAPKYKFCHDCLNLETEL